MRALKARLLALLRWTCPFCSGSLWHGAHHRAGLLGPDYIRCQGCQNLCRRSRHWSVALWAWPVLLGSALLLQGIRESVQTQFPNYWAVHAAVFGAVAGLLIGLMLTVGAKVKPIRQSDIDLSQLTSRTRKGLELLFVVVITALIGILIDKNWAVTTAMASLMLVELFSHFLEQPETGLISG